MNAQKHNGRKHDGKVFVATVGTGHRDDLERTLFTPMKMSIAAGEWEKVILLPSRKTEENARTLERMAGEDIIIRSLPEPGQENDADACFGHFDEVIGKVIDEGFPPEGITVDFTRGTKAMSAALVLAAVRRDVPALRYVHSEQRDEHGTVVPGTEEVGEFRTVLATGRRDLDLAMHLLQHGDFGAVARMLPDANGPFPTRWPRQLRDEAAGLGALARVGAAWDRLDHAGAQTLIKRHSDTLRHCPSPFRFPDEVHGWIGRLADRPKQEDAKNHAEMVAWLRAVACDLLANAERRVRSRQFEDALLRAYRILELVGQIRLFDKGYDSSCISPEDAVVSALRHDLAKKGSNDFGVNKKGKTLTAPREIAARLLGRLEDRLAERLRQFDNERDVKTRDRNMSILIHGFTATAPPEAEPLERILRDLDELLKEDDPDAGKRLTLARALSFDQT